MAVIENVLRAGINVKLNAGTSPSGGMIVRSVSLGKVIDGADADKVMNVAGALSPVLNLPPVYVERTRVTRLEVE
ncbi:hypothetical protein FACS1894187_04800 [Synergistales bacterium]|nr:hypothetical protein FACS1894187_04800 [Synergistales bacterium]